MRSWCCVVVSLYVVSTAFAQEAKRDTIKKIYKDDIVVTSTRMPENAKDIPMAVSAVPAEAYKDSRGYELKDALWSVPGVVAQSRGGHTDQRITIRGYGARGAGDRSNAGNMRGIRVLLDGIPETEPDGRTVLDMVDLFTITNVEVLRSNASTLYGSASGGVISLNTDQHFPNSYLETRHNFGSFGYMKNAYMTGARMGTSTLFASYSKTSADGYRQHSKSSAENMYAAIRAELDDYTSMRITAGAAFNEFRFPGALTMAQFETDPTQADSVYIARDERRYDRVGRIGITIDRILHNEHSVSGTLYLQPRIITRSERGTYRDFTRYNIGSNGQYSWSTKLSDDLKSLLIAGFDQQYQDGAILFYSLNPDASRGSLRTNQIEPASNIGFYLQEEFFVDAFEFTAGGRYDMIRYISQDMLTSLPAETKKFSNFTPKFSVGYKLDNNTTLYALLGGGVEAPAFNEINPPDSATIVSRGGTYDKNARFNPLLEPVISTSYELGLKGTLPLSGGEFIMSYDLAAFMIGIKNDLVPWNGGAYYFTAGKTSRKGLECGIGAYTSFGVTLKSAITVMDAKYDEYENNLGVYNGNKQAGIPSLTANARLRYDYSPMRDLNLFIEAGLEHIGEYYADDRNDKLPDGSPDPNTVSLVPSYMIFNGTFGATAMVSNFDINLFVNANNLTDKRYIGSAFINGINQKYFEPGMARNSTFGIGIKYAFGRS